MLDFPIPFHLTLHYRYKPTSDYECTGGAEYSNIDAQYVPPEVILAQRSEMAKAIDISIR